MSYAKVRRKIEIQTPLCSKRALWVNISISPIKWRGCKVSPISPIVEYIPYGTKGGFMCTVA